MDPLEAIRMVTVNTAGYFGLRDVGAVAPGYRADLLILSSLSPLRVRSVIKGGRRIFDEGVYTGREVTAVGAGHAGAMSIRPFGPEAFRIPHGERGSG